jgi:hypothetical protein
VSRKVIVVNVILLVLLVWLGMRLRAYWQQAKAREQAALGRAAQALPVLPPPPAPGVQPAAAAEYIDVAQRLLFAKDRDPNVVIVAEPPPPPPPEPPAPPLPEYYGQMNFGEPVIVLGLEGKQKSYRVGERIGEFTVAAFDRESITLEWRDKRLRHELRELTPKPATRSAAPAPPAPAASAAAAPPAANVAKMGGSSAAKPDTVFGKQLGMVRLCLPDDPSPEGTVKDGYRKVIVNGLMGPSCSWEPIR